GVAGGDVAVGVQGSDGKRSRGPLGNRRWETANNQSASGSRLDDDARVATGDAAGRGVGGCDRLTAGRLERDGGGEHALVAGGEGVVGRQHGLRIVAGEVDRAGVAGVDGAVRLQGGNGETAGRAGRETGGTADRERAGALSQVAGHQALGGGRRKGT